MQKFLLSTFLCIISSFLFGQLSHHKRLEFPLKDEFRNEKLQVLGEGYFLIRSERTQTPSQNTEWKFELFNQDLQSEGIKRVFLNRSFYLKNSLNVDKVHHSIFRNRAGAYQMLSLDMVQRKVYQVEGNLGRKSRFGRLSILEDYIYLSIKERRSQYLLRQNWKTGERNIIPIQIPGVEDRYISVSGMQVLEEAGEVLVYLRVFLNKHQRETYILRLTEGGSEQELIRFQLDEKKFPHAITARKLGSTYTFMGTYSSHPTNNPEGLFFTKYQDTEALFFRRYPFLELENFLNYMSAKHKKRLLNKKERKEALGKTFTPQHRIAAHELIALEDGFLSMGEAYYPTYEEDCTTSTTTCPDGTTTTTTNCDDEFDGYQYTHALITKFDQEGHLVWDQCFSMWPQVKPHAVKRFININQSATHSLNMLFVNNHQLVSKSISYEDGFELEQKEKVPIFTGFEGDQTKGSISHLQYWYGDYFLAYGRQRIKNFQSEHSQTKRKVFFVNKLAY